MLNIGTSLYVGAVLTNVKLHKVDQVRVQHQFWMQIEGNGQAIPDTKSIDFM